MYLSFKLRKNDGGFFSQIWELMAYSIFARINNLDFVIDDSNWLFRHTHGWHDYFSSYTIQNTTTPECFEVLPKYMINHFTLNDYRQELQKQFRLNNTLNHLLHNTMNSLSLVDGEYDAIMIRRGDKMYGESQYISTKVYVDRILEKNPKKIFVQTDDYNAYKEVCELAKGVEVFTTCPNTKFGSFVFNYNPEVGSTVSKENNDYLVSLQNIQQKTVNTYTSNEIKEHTEEMIVGLQICLRSRFLCIDFQSNVTRFLTVSFPKYENLLSIENLVLDFSIPVICPNHGFIPSRSS